MSEGITVVFFSMGFLLGIIVTIIFMLWFSHR